MSTADENTLFQSEHHPLIDRTPVILEDHCLGLIHRKAYETAAEMCRERAVLDLGCNDGYGTAIIARNAVRAVGLDLSSRAIEAARRSRPGIEFRLFEGGALPFDDQSFDIVTAFQVIEHVAEPEPFLREIRRVLRAGGRALFTTPNRLLRLNPGMTPWNAFHVREYSSSELAEVLRTTFDDVEVKGLLGSEPLERVERGRTSRHRRLQRFRRRGIAGRVVAACELRLFRAYRQASTAAMKVPFIQKAQRRRFEDYRTNDLGYSEHNLEDALDLMAIASVR